MSEKKSQTPHLTTGGSRDHAVHESRSPSPLVQTSSSSKLGSHRRSLALRPSAHGHSIVGSTAQVDSALASSVFQETNGATPNFELPQGSMFVNAHAWENGPSDHDWQVYDAPSGSRSKSVPPHAYNDEVQTGQRRWKEAAQKLPPIQTAHRAGSKKRNFFGEAGKRPASPHITSATPTSARHHHHVATDRRSSIGPVQRIASPHDDVGGESFTIDQAVMARSTSNRSPPTRQTSLGRVAANAAHSLMDAVAGRTSPTAHYHGGRTSRKQNRDSISDDEAGKGHGKRSMGRYTPSFNQNRNVGFAAYPRDKTNSVSFQHANRYPDLVAEPEEIIEGLSGNVEWRASLSESRRATPAAYRPRPGTPRQRGSSGHKADPDDSSDMLAHSTRSTSHSIHIGSPIVVPQARRGAIRLKPRRSRRSSRLLRPRLTLKQRSQLAVVRITNFLRLLASPVEASHRIREWCVDTRVYWDDAFRDPVSGARCWRPAWLQAYVPLFIWLGISLSSTALVITFHTEVFTGLDRLAAHLQALGLRGRLLLGSLIFITTFPPLPLYSTLIILCGFSFGLWQGFIISYVSALLGGIVVFMLSRSLLKDWMVGLLNQSGGLKKVVRAIEKQPKLLFLVRLAPYPYNLMNTLLASSQTLTLKTYTICTAIALPKLLVHTALGTSIKNFAAYNGADADGTGLDEEDVKASRTAETVKHVAGFAGIGLCVGIFIYLLQVARKAVDEVDDEDHDEGGRAFAGAAESDDLLSDDSLEEGQEARRGRCDLINESEDEGMDMREQFGPGSQGFKNGYAPILSSAEDRLREQMRHSVVSMERTSRSLEEAGSGGSAGPSVDLAEKIAEMEAHAEGMEFGGVTSLHPAGSRSDGGHFVSPTWLNGSESPDKDGLFLGEDMRPARGNRR